MKPVAVVVAKLAATMPASATTEPTERSMPRVRITKVMPIASTPLIEVWRSTLRMLPGRQEVVADEAKHDAGSRQGQ